MISIARPCHTVGIAFFGLLLSAGRACGDDEGTAAGQTTANDRSSGHAGTWAGTAPSCTGLPATCGPSGNEDCCKSLLVPGGTFARPPPPPPPPPLLVEVLADELRCWQTSSRCCSSRS
ncbi:hypothetical protein [Sorangium sp. So ce1182]|uniref:hypothetical protein n=1 Tax=Sorangium sp. So ce1182 TaxID=3133334 RepID=UPI003F5F6125